MYQSRQAFLNQADGSEQLRLSEILGAFSYALDLTEGQPAGHSIRACWIGTQIAMALGLKGAALRDVYYAVLLKDLGCSSNAARVSEMFVGDDRKLKQGFKLIGPRPEDLGEYIAVVVGADAEADVRERALGNIAERYQLVARLQRDISQRDHRIASFCRKLHHGTPQEIRLLFDVGG